MVFSVFPIFSKKSGNVMSSRKVRKINAKMEIFDIIIKSQGPPELVCIFFRLLSALLVQF